jgi:hypothetical protein
MFGIFEVGAMENIEKYLEKFKWIGPTCQRSTAAHDVCPVQCAPTCAGDAMVARPPPATSRRRCRPITCRSTCATFVIALIPAAAHR